MINIESSAQPCVLCDRVLFLLYVVVVLDCGFCGYLVLLLSWRAQATLHQLSCDLERSFFIIYLILALFIVVSVSGILKPAHQTRATYRNLCP